MIDKTCFATIPQELKDRQQWVCYRIEERDSKKTKVPYRPDGTGRDRAKTNDPATWHAFDEVVEAAIKPQNQFDGIGFVLSESDPYVFIDLDHVVENRRFDEQAWGVVDKIASYTEYSQSGTGMHVVARAKKPGTRCRTAKCPKFEIYDKLRLVVFTGKQVLGAAYKIIDAQEAIDKVYFDVFGDDATNASPKETANVACAIEMSDAELIQKALSAANGNKFGWLWDGNTDDYEGDDSAADMALCCMLAFWTQRDPARMDRLFRDSELMRDKWDEARGDRTYGAMTIDAAIKQTTEVYQGSPNRDLPGSLTIVDGGKQLTTGANQSEPDQVPIRTRRFPEPIAAEALRGLAGDFIRLVEPHSEADPTALLLSYFVAYGNVIGRNAHFLAEEDRHYMNLFAVQVGSTAKGRKGTSWGQVKRVFREIDPDWSSGRTVDGLSSGEGLIWSVRDAIEKEEPIRENKHVVGYQTVITDNGVADKRLLVMEGEFSSTLRVMGRDGNNLSAVIRNAWDSGDLSILTKNTPAQSTGAHISIIGHITKDELLRYLENTEAGNGFGNRFLWICVKRSKVLPEGGRPDDGALFSHTQRLRTAVGYARSVGEMTRDDSARKLWNRVYPDLSEGKPGLLGAMIARAEAQVMRLACIYALMDHTSVVSEEHLRAALAVWRYAEDSARFIFGDSLGDPVADELLKAIRSRCEGLTRTDISNLFGRNRGAREIGRALGVLSEQGLVREEHVSSGGGRPSEVWYAVLSANETNERNEITSANCSLPSYPEDELEDDADALG